MEKKNINVYKPRYKIAFQSKSIVWPYKNSRLRRFFNIRGRKLIRRGYFKRYFLVFNNMKWVIARRFIQPYKVLKYPVRRKYKKLFYTKQQIRHFYGKVKEQRFRNFFKKFLTSVIARNKSFYSFMELRLDMVVFRLKFMPTIYAAHQLVLHHGILINKGVKTSPNQLVRIGDIIALSKKQWKSIFFNFYSKSFYRSYGKWTLRRRQKKLLKKKSYWLFKRIRSFKRKNIRLLRKNFISTKYCFKLKKNFYKAYLKLYVILHKAQARSYDKKQFFPLFVKLFQLKVKFNKLFKRFMLKLKELKKWRTKSRKKITYARHRTFVKGKFKFILRKKKFKNKGFLRKWRWQGYFKKFIKWSSALFVEYKNLYFFKVLIELYKLKVLQFIERHEYAKTFSDKTNILYIKQNLLYKKYRKYVLQKYVLFQQKLNQFYFFFLRKRLKKKLWYSFANMTSTKKIKPIKWRAALSYFMIYKKFKKKRRLLIPRLKKVHWYVPQYFHFDIKTLRGVVLRNPMSNEVFYSFRGSLSKVYSFYKSRGY